MGLWAVWGPVENMWKLWAAILDSPATCIGLSEHGGRCARHVLRVWAPVVCMVELQFPGLPPAFLDDIRVCHGATGSEPGATRRFPRCLEKGKRGAPPTSLPSSLSPRVGAINLPSVILHLRFRLHLLLHETGSASLRVDTELFVDSAHWGHQALGKSGLSLPHLPPGVSRPFSGQLLSSDLGCDPIAAPHPVSPLCEVTRHQNLSHPFLSGGR